MGVGVRHCGLVCHLVARSLFPDISARLKAEMTARCAKRILRARLRQPGLSSEAAASIASDLMSDLIDPLLRAPAVAKLADNLWRSVFAECREYFGFDLAGGGLVSHETLASGTPSPANLSSFSQLMHPWV